MELQKKFQIGEMVFRKWRYPNRPDYWYEPYFVVRMTERCVWVEEFMGPTYRISRRHLERSGFDIHRGQSAVFYVELPEEYRKQTIGYLMDEEPRRILGLSDGFTPEDLKAAYRRAVVGAHPDKGGAHDQFIKVQAAYEKLKA